MQPQHHTSASSRQASSAFAEYDAESEFDAYEAAVTAPRPAPVTPATLASSAVQRHAAPNIGYAAHRRDGSAAGYQSRFAFQHSARLFVALLPALLVVMLSGGKPLVVIASLCGVMCYLSDALGSTEGAFVVGWVGAIAAMACLALNHSIKSGVLGGVANMLLFIHMNFVMFLVALTSSCSFEFLARELNEWYVERFLFGASLLSITSVEFLAAVSILGMDGASWVLGLILLANYTLLLTPRASSSQLVEEGMDAASMAEQKKHDATRQAALRAQQSRSQFSASAASSLSAAPLLSSKKLAPASIPLEAMDLIVSPAVSMCYALLVVCIPYLFYLAVHHHFLSDHLLASEGILLISSMVLALGAVHRGDLLWFTLLPLTQRVLIARLIMGFAALFWMVALQAKVLVPVFGRHLVFFPNWTLIGHLVLSIGMGAAMLAAAMLFGGGIHASSERTAAQVSSGEGNPKEMLFRTLLHIAAFSAGLSLGVPLYVYIFLAVGSWSASLILISGSSAAAASSVSSLSSSSSSQQGFSGQSLLALLVGVLLWSVGMHLLIDRSLGFLEFGIRMTEAAAEAAQYFQGSQAFSLWVLATLAAVIPAAFILLEAVTRQIGSLDFLSRDLNLPIPTALTSGPGILRFLKALIGCLLALYIFVLAGLEWDWTRMDARGLFDSHIYSWYLVCFTSGCGLYLAHTLKHQSRIGSTTYAVLVGLNVWKAGVLFFDDRTDLFSFMAVVFVQVPLWLGYQPSEAPATATFIRGSGVASAAPGRMGSFAALAHAVSIVAVFWYSKNTILAHALHASGLASLVSGGLPNESIYVAAFLLSVGLALTPISFKHLRADAKWRRWNVLFLLVSLLFFVVNPRLDFIAGLDDSSDVFERGMDLVAPRWPEWLLFIALVTALVSVENVGMAAVASSSASASGASAGMVSRMRAVLALVLGSSLGLYICGVSLPFQPALYSLLMSACNTTAIFLVFMFLKAPRSHTPSTGEVVSHEPMDRVWNFFKSSAAGATHVGGSTLLPLAYCVLLALLPVTYVSIGIIYAPPPLVGVSSGATTGRGARLVGPSAAAASQAATLSDVRLLYRTATLAMHAAFHFLVALGINLHREIVLANQSKEARIKNLAAYASSSPSAAVGVGGTLRAGSSLLSSLSAPLAAELSTLLYLGNLATLSCFLLLSYLWLAYLGGGSGGVLVLAPLLLLVNQDNSAFGRKLILERKWWPVVAGTLPDAHTGG